MGKRFGEILVKSEAEFPIILDDFQRKFGAASQKLLHQYYPEVVEEIKGVTDTIAYDHELFTSWMMCMGCCLDISNDRSVEVRGCTAFAFTDNVRVYYARNNDLPPYLKKVSKSVFYRPDNGNAFILNTSSFINGEEGINDKGLVAAMTFVKPLLDEVKPGINSVFLVRYLLEKCGSTQEGLQALKKLPIASSCNILLADQSGDMAVAECNPCRTNIRMPEIANGNKFVVTVNHFVSEEMYNHDASDRNEYYSAIRYETAVSSLKKPYAQDSIEYAMDILKGKFGFMCQYDKHLDFQTIWGTVIDINRRMMHRAEGDPRRAKFKPDARLAK